MSEKTVNLSKMSEKRVWVVSCWLNRSSYDNTIIGVYTDYDLAVKAARAHCGVEMIQHCEDISEGYYEETKGYDSMIISVNECKLDVVDEVTEKFTDEENAKFIEAES